MRFGDAVLVRDVHRNEIRIPLARELRGQSTPCARVTVVRFTPRRSLSQAC
jgi:hypothetical protein